MAQTNILVDWLNKNKKNIAQGALNTIKNVQNVVNNSSATNPTNATPNLPTVTSSTVTPNYKRVQEPVQTKLNNLNDQTKPTVAMMNGQPMTETSLQSRFIGFQQPKYQTSTIGTLDTTPQATSFERLLNGGYTYIPSAINQAQSSNYKEENRYKTQADALEALQSDIYYQKRSLTRNEISENYPEFKDNIDVVMELQDELTPIILDQGMYVSDEQLAQKYNELIQPKNLKDVEDIKKKSELSNKNFQQLDKTISKALKTDWELYSTNGLKYIQNAKKITDAVKIAKQQGIVGGANDFEIARELAKSNPELQQAIKEMDRLELTESDKVRLGKSGNLLVAAREGLQTGIWNDIFGESETPISDEELDSAIRARDKLENDFWRQTGKKIATEIGVPLDSLEKFTYRTYKDIQNKILETGMEYTKDYAKKQIKSAFKEGLGVELTDEQLNSIDNVYNTAVAPSINEQIKTNQQNVMDYIESVNKEYESRKRRNLDTDVENYVNNRSMTQSLLAGDLSSFAYKAAGETAQNAEMPLIIAAGVVAPEVVLPLMAVDSYSRENQEAFEELTKAGANYEQAQEGAAIVGLASSAVELTLEKLLGGVETTASKAIKDIITKDFTKKATEMVAEKGLVELLKNGAVTQFRSSFEEGLEEVLQQVIHNTAIQKYDPNQEITQGLWESFEGGFFNPMNLLAGGGEIFDNISENADYYKQNAYETAYNLGQKTRQVTDKVDNTLNRGAYNAGVISRDVVDIFKGNKNNIENNENIENVESNENIDNDDIDGGGGSTPPSVPVNKRKVLGDIKNKVTGIEDNAIEVEDDTTEEKQTTAIKEGSMGGKVMDMLNGLDENTRERIKKNPYSVEESKNLINEMENDPGIDFGDYQNGRYEDVLGTVLEKLEQKENKRRNDIGKLYDKLEETNTPVDVTGLKNKVAEFQAQAEAIEDMATPAEQAQIKTILENIEKIGDGTMDVWKVRRMADKRSKRSASSTYDGIGLIWDIRDAIDDVIVEQNPDMKEVDKEYRKVLKEISEIKGKLFYKNGGLKSNAVSTIKNMLNASNRLDLNNLEKYLPGIKQQLEAIRDSKFVYNAYSTGKGSRFISGIARGVFGNLGKALGFVGFGWGGLLGGAVIDSLIDKAMVNLTRSALKQTITKETEKSKAELEKINKKIEEGKELDAKDKARLKELGEKIMRNAKDLAEKNGKKIAWNKFINNLENNITPQTTEEEGGVEKNKVTSKKVTKKAGAKNKVTNKNPKSVDKRGTNDYNTTTTSSNTSPVNLSQQEEATTGIKSSSSGATPRGGKLEGPTTAFSVNKQWDIKTNESGTKTVKIGNNEYKNEKPEGLPLRKRKKKQFTNDYKFEVSEDNQGYLSSLQDLLGGKIDEANISKSIILTAERLGHIFEKHGEFLLENLIESVNNYDNIVYNPEGSNNTRLLKKIPGSNNFFKVVVSNEGGRQVVTFFEKVTGNADAYNNELNKGKRAIENKPRSSLSENSITKKSENARESKNAITSKKSAVTEYVNETPQNERGQMEEIEAEENLRNNETPQRDIVEETPKNKVTAKKTEATTPKQEENQTSEHFSYENYGEFMKKYEAAEKEINDRLDKQMDKERAEKMERFNELTKKEDKTDAEGKEMMKLAGELNNMPNKYDRLKEQEFNKKYPELVAEKKRQQEMFDRDWKAAMDKKMEEINKPFNNLRDKYLKELRDELGIADDVTLDSDFYNSLTPEQKKIADKINKEYAEKYEELRQKTASIKKIEEDTKTKITKNKKNKVTNPSKVKESGLFNENEVDKGNKSEGLNPDALPLSDYREMQRLNDGYSLTSLSSALSKESLKDYMANKIANEKIGVKPDWDDNEAWDKLPEDFEDDWENVASDIEDMYDAYEEYSDMKNGGDTFDENTLKNTLESANDYANRQFPGKTAKEVIDQYTPEYESDLKVYNRLIKKYPSVFANGKIDLTGLEGKSLREFAGQENETAQDIDYQELAELENQTPQDIDYQELVEQENITPQIEETENDLSKTKVVDKDGNPLKVYHGTNVEGDTIYLDVRTEPGYWFTADRDYAKEHSKTGNVREAYLDMRNPLTLEKDEGIINGLLKDAFGDKATRGDEQIFSKEFKNAAIKKGYDGLIFEHSGENTYIVFNKDQIVPINRQTTTEITGEKNAVTAKKVEESKPKNVLTNPVENSAFETLPNDVTVSQEAKQLGAKRIAPDRVPRQQLTFGEGVNKIAENLETLAEYKKAHDEIYSPEGYNDGEIYIRYNRLRKEFQNIMYGDKGFQFKSNKSKEFSDLWKNIVDNKDNKTALREVAKNFYISKVKKDISKGYVYPQEVLDKIPGAKKAIDNRERYEKGLNTSFSAKDERIDYSEKDKIGAGMKSQDGKQITKEQKEDIVKGILDFGKTLGLDMKKFAEDRGLVYVHLHGGLAFLNNMAAGLYRESTNEQGEKNISVSVGGAENVRYKDKKTKERKTTTLNTTMSHELGHAMDYLLDNKLFSWTQKSILGSKYNPVNRLRKYYAKGNEIVARAIEQYVAVENGQPNYYLENGNLDAGEFKGTDLEYALKEVGSYYERPGYWSKADYEKYVKPYVEEAFKNNFEEYKINKSQKNVLGNDKNKVTTQAARAYSPTIVMRLDDNGNPLRTAKNKVTSRKVEKNQTSFSAESRNKIGQAITKMRDNAQMGGLNVPRYTKNGPIENALNTIYKINSMKKKIRGQSYYENVLDGKEKGLIEIANVLDNGYKDEDINYKWFYDPLDEKHPTIIFWKGDDIKDSDKVWALHLEKNETTNRSINKFRNSRGRLEKTPLRSKKRGK